MALINRTIATGRQLAGKVTILAFGLNVRGTKSTQILFLANRTNGLAIGSVASVVCRLSVTLCIVAKRCVLEQTLVSYY